MAEGAEAIRRSALFADVEGTAFAALNARLSPLDLPSEAVLCPAGAPVDSAYFLVSGAVIEEWPDGIVTHHEPGAILIPTALLGDQPSQHKWHVLSTAQLLRLRRRDFAELLEDQSAAARCVLIEVCKVLVVQLRDLNRAFNELMQQNMK